MRENLGKYKKVEDSVGGGQMEDLVKGRKTHGKKIGRGWTLPRNCHILFSSSRTKCISECMYSVLKSNLIPAASYTSGMVRV